MKMIIKRLLLPSLSLLFLFFAIGVQAKTLHPVIKLLKFEEVTTQEKRGEELFLHVTEYHSHGLSSSKTIPSHPTFWPSEHLKKVKNVKIWEGDVKEGDSVIVLISAMEKDFHPWNTDDIIGTVRARIRNENGRLTVNWSMPNRADSPDEIRTKYGVAQKFTLIGNGNKYILYLILK